MLTDFLDESALRYPLNEGGTWCYEDGCSYCGLELLNVETGEPCWLDQLRRLIDTQVGLDGSLAGYALSGEQSIGLVDQLTAQSLKPSSNGAVEMVDFCNVTGLGVLNIDFVMVVPSII